MFKAQANLAAVCSARAQLHPMPPRPCWAAPMWHLAVLSPSTCTPACTQATPTRQPGSCCMPRTNSWGGRRRRTRRQHSLTCCSRRGAPLQAGWVRAWAALCMFHARWLRACAALHVTKHRRHRVCVRACAWMCVCMCAHAWLQVVRQKAGCTFECAKSFYLHL